MKPSSDLAASGAAPEYHPQGGLPVTRHTTGIRTPSPSSIYPKHPESINLWYESKGIPATIPVHLLVKAAREAADGKPGTQAEIPFSKQAKNGVMVVNLQQLLTEYIVRLAYPAQHFILIVTQLLTEGKVNIDNAENMVRVALADKADMLTEEQAQALYADYLRTLGIVPEAVGMIHRNPAGRPMIARPRFRTSDNLAG